MMLYNNRNGSPKSCLDKVQAAFLGCGIYLHFYHGVAQGFHCRHRNVSNKEEILYKAYDDRGTLQFAKGAWFQDRHPLLSFHMGN